jgi:hypothetical protein
MVDVFVRKTEDADVGKINPQCISTAEAWQMFAYDMVDNSGPYSEPGRDGYVCPEDIFYDFAILIAEYRERQRSALMKARADDVESVVDASKWITYYYADMFDRLQFELKWLTSFAERALEAVPSGRKSDLDIILRSASMAIHDIVINEAAALEDVYEMLKMKSGDPECFDESMERYLEANDVDAHFRMILEYSRDFFSRGEKAKTWKRTQEVHVTNRPIVFIDKGR